LNPIIESEKYTCPISIINIIGEPIEIMTSLVTLDEIFPQI